MSKLKAIIFDADGTLLNSFELIVAAYAHVAKVHGLKSPTAEEVRMQLGRSLPDIYRTFYPDHDVEPLLAENSSFISANAGQSSAFEGVSDLLDALTGAGLKVAILTSGGHRIHDVLEHHGIKQYFSSIVHHESITNPKPDPEGFFLAVKECGVTAGEAAMVGDSVQDILAGKNGKAGLVVGVTHGFGKREDLEKAGADILVDTIEELGKVLQDSSISV